MWEKAACLVADEESITTAPGLSHAIMVASFTCPQKPYLVNMMAKGKMTCDCLNYKTRSLCLHVLAVAEKSSLLADLMEWFTTTNQGMSDTKYNSDRLLNTVPQLLYASTQT